MDDWNRNVGNPKHLKRFKLKQPVPKAKPYDIRNYTCHFLQSGSLASKRKMQNDLIHPNSTGSKVEKFPAIPTCFMISLYSLGIINI